MSKIAVNEITDEVGTGSPAFTNGLAQSDIAGALNATGTAPIYACRAWVNFDGATATIRGSGNVSSITKNGTGDYTINFATAMPDNNYVIGGTTNNNFGASYIQEFQQIQTPTANSDRIQCTDTRDAAARDPAAVMYMAIR